jgi:hypothetical protein
MTDTEDPTDADDAAFLWMQVANHVARGRFTPEEGVARLQGLVKTHPEDREWLLEEIETIRQQFGLDVADVVHDSQASYWEKLRAVIEALLEERLDHERSLELLERIADQHPEHLERTRTLINDIGNSELRRYLDPDD